MKLLFLSFKPILYTPCLVLGLKLCRPHFCFASCCYLLGSGNEDSGRTHKARGRRRNVLFFVGLYLFPVPVSNMPTMLFSRVEAAPSRGRIWIQFAIFPSLAEPTSMYSFSDTSTGLPALPLQKSESQFHWSLP